LNPTLGGDSSARKLSKRSGGALRHFIYAPLRNWVRLGAVDAQTALLTGSERRCSEAGPVAVTNDHN